jgi:hypothetical protein
VTTQYATPPLRELIIDSTIKLFIMKTTTVAAWTLVGSMSTAVVVNASSDFHSNIHLPYVFSEINSMEYHDAENDEYQQQDSAANEELPTEIVSSVAMAMMDGGCYHVSAQAIMCHGGDSASLSSEPIMYVDASTLNSADLDYSEEEQENEDDQDDDDDDDDDGHSSMLSNSALYRRPRAVVGVSASGTTNAAYYSSSQASAGAAPKYLEGQGTSGRHKSWSMSYSRSSQLQNGPELSATVTTILSRKLVMAAMDKSIA